MIAGIMLIVVSVMLLLSSNKNRQLTAENELMKEQLGRYFHKDVRRLE